MSRPPSHHDDGHDRHDDSDIGGDMMTTLVANLVIIEVVTTNIIFDHIFEKNGKGDLFHVMHDHEDHDAYLLEVRVLPNVVAGERLPI